MQGKDSVIVSVIIPTFNQAEFLQTALQSLQSQSFENWEAMVIDNYSSDSTREVTMSFQDSRIKYLLFSNNGVIAASRNKGIQESRGEYIAFLDSDDLWYPEKLTICIEQLKKENDIVCHGLAIRRNGVLTTDITPILHKNRVFETLLYRGNPGIATSAVVAKKNLFNLYGLFSEDPSLITAEDYELWLRFAKAEAGWGFITTNLGEYTIHGKNASRNIEKQMLAEEKVVRKYTVQEKSVSFRKRILVRKRLILITMRAAKRVLDDNGIVSSVTFLIKRLSNM